MFFVIISGTLLSNSTLRLLNPECLCNRAWSQETLSSQASRVIERLYSESVSENTSSYENQSQRTLYPAPSFSFMFYLLSCVLVDNGKAVGNDEALMGKVLKVIASHAQLRHCENNPVSFIVKF